MLSLEKLQKYLSFAILRLSKVNLPSAEVNGVKTLIIQEFERKILTSMKEILSLSHQKDVGLVQVLLSTRLLQSKCFNQKITKVKLLEQPTTWLRGLSLKFQWKPKTAAQWFYILILNWNISSSFNYQLALNYSDVMTIRFIKVSYCWGGPGYYLHYLSRGRIWCGPVGR